MSLKLGIAHPIPNNRFNKCNVLATTIINTWAKSTSVNIPGGAPSDLNRFFGTIYGSSSKQIIGEINKCILGPSTHSSNVGAVEILSVVSVSSSSTINFKNSVTYSYNVGDPITMIGVGLPDGWGGRWPTGSTKDFSYGSILTDNGYSDQFCFNVYSVSGAPANYATCLLPKLAANTYYRLEIVYRSTNQAGSVYLRVYDGSRVYNVGSNIVLNPQTLWTAAHSVFKSVNTQTLLPLLLLWFSTGTSANKFEVASISLTHASHDSLSVYKTAGVSTIIEYPDMGSIKINRITESTRLGKDSRGNRFLDIVLKDVNLPVTRYRVSFNLSHISEGNVNTLMNLLDWQQRGYLVNYFPDIVGLPYCLTGRISLSFSSRFLMTDLTRKSFSFMFEEVLV